MQQSWAILAQLAPSWGYFGTLFGPAGGYLGLLRGHFELFEGLLGAKSLLETRVLKSPYGALADLDNLGVHSGAQNWHLFCYLRGHVLDNFWSSFGVNFGAISVPKVESKSGPFFGKAPGGHLEALWEASWLS